MSYTVFLGLLLVWCCGGTVLGQKLPDNPCPNIFSYLRRNDGLVYGRIVVPYDGSTKQTYLTVNASLAGIFDTAKLSIQLTNPKKSILGTSSISYDVFFPFQNVLPKITQIKFNGEILCSGEPEPLLPGRGVTNIWSSFTYSIREYVVGGNSPNFGQVIPTPNPTDSNLITNNPTTTNQNEEKPNGKPNVVKPNKVPNRNVKEEIKNICGTENNVQSLVINGQGTSDNEFPWVTAMLVYDPQNGYQYKCTANLITDRHVVTAAQCVQFFKAPIVEPENILFILGKSDLSRWATSNAERRSAKKITVHPEYKQYTGHGDLAVIEFDSPVEFSRTVRPICLWSRNDDSLLPVIGKDGKVCGWGQNKPSGSISIPAYEAVNLPIVSQESCLRSNAAFQNLTSTMTFCAGDKSGSGPCVGDSGAGFMIKNDEKRWTLRGTVSIALKDGTSCKLDEYVVFCDVAKYGDWIRKIVKMDV